MEAVSLVLYLVGSLVVLGTVLPIWKSTRWWVRLWDFPRFQIAAVGTVVCVLIWGTGRPIHPLGFSLLAAVGLSCAWQVSWIWRYLPLAPLEAPGAAKGGGRADQALSLVTANVLQEARDADGLLRIIREADPDVVLAVETDEWWCSRLSEELSSAYPSSLVYPLSNGFGISLFSRLDLVEPKIRFLVDREIPSVKTGIRLRSGAVIHLYGMHPRPPAPAQDSDERDQELVLVGYEISEANCPSIVLGDLNDVAWSPTTTRFKKAGSLLDPRRGRGFFNTYPARLPGLRYPLDYIFHTFHFAVGEMRVLPRFGSDHLPLLVRLQLRKQSTPDQRAGVCDSATEQRR